jgi:hypothetical protein
MNREAEICKEQEQTQMEDTEQMSGINLLNRLQKDHDEVTKDKRKRYN